MKYFSLPAAIGMVMMAGAGLAAQPADAARSDDGAGRVVVMTLMKHIVYPDKAKEQNLEGTVRLTLTTDSDGAARDITIDPASPKILADAVLEAVHTGPYIAPFQVPIEGTFLIRTTFTLLASDTGAGAKEGSGQQWVLIEQLPIDESADSLCSPLASAGRVFRHRGPEEISPDEYEFVPVEMVPTWDPGELLRLTDSEIRGLAGYPDHARSPGIKGSATVTVLVDTTGRLLAYMMEKSSGSVVLDRAAQAALIDLPFTPAMYGGVRVRVWTQVPVTFQLR